MHACYGKNLCVWQGTELAVEFQPRSPRSTLVHLHALLERDNAWSCPRTSSLATLASRAVRVCVASKESERERCVHTNSKRCHPTARRERTHAGACGIGGDHRRQTNCVKHCGRPERVHKRGWWCVCECRCCVCVVCVCVCGPDTTSAHRSQVKSDVFLEQ
jgi:hypothetical protein